MSTRDDIQQFLTSRRARLTPEQVGLQSYGRRRVPGLRREEVAMLAQVSVEYYSRLERGNLGGVSESILESLVLALRLNDVEERHLRDLIRASENTVRPRRQRPPQQLVRPTVQRMLDAMTELPAIVQNGRLDIIAANRMGRALYAAQFDTTILPPNQARFIFLDPRGRDFAPDWDRAANECVAMLRAAAGRDPHDRQVSDLIGELSTRSDEFRIRWAAHNVHQHKSGTKRIHLPSVGDLTLDFEVMELIADPGLTFITFSAEPGSPSHDALQLLSSWAATTDATNAVDARGTT
ncbi:helix-turn-helix transcriptional regulator [Arthrobacter sp. FW306-2-2C-D06B]|uniref:helix-turn-helix transcriptional regulator n=1 Tax=Arthrobacter sp. FW306-2-2C-D06B TaxID=2879618 RepID=UPI001F199E8E|nr:helix-turn-helix transcriptional regulator [Arthrobacter sp. FW306-2-2C-D06B]UKA60444.1 helix-turn-helix transcriptional regulator [Arthrobacter sp. FW306-2-2C-D06B]